MPEELPNVLAQRYASPEMVEIFSPTAKVIAERRLWVEVLRIQSELGMEVPEKAIADYEAVIEQVDLDSIEERERQSRHDVKARIDEFCALAGHEHIHRGLTSRDITENIEQAQVRAALGVAAQRLVAVIARLCSLADRYRDLAMVGRTHNVAAQVTTLGKRWATIGTEALAAHARLVSARDSVALRGLKGPVGTQQDLADIFGSNAAAVAELEQRVATHLGFSKLLASTGQTYPRSFDFDAVSALVFAAAPLSSSATLVRLMAGHDLATEGFSDTQVGSSAMPHKMNTRSSERIAGLVVVLRGHLSMVSELSGQQWNEGDVSCSVVRRVALPDAFFAFDAAAQSCLEVLDNFGAYEAPIAAELATYLPFLATTRLLGAAVAKGCGREEAHEAIRTHAVAAVKTRLGVGESDSAGEGATSGAGAGDLVSRIVADKTLGLTEAAVKAALEDLPSFTGLASSQIDAFLAQAQAVLTEDPAAASYQPPPTI